MKRGINSGDSEEMLSSIKKKKAKRGAKRKPVSDFDVAEESPGFLLWKVSLIWRRGIEEVLRPFNLTHTQFVLLAGTWYLTKENPSVMQKIVCEFTGCDVSMSSRVIRSLADMHLISREHGKKDTRAILLELTPEGLKVLKGAIKAVEEYDENFFKTLGANRAHLNT